MANRKITMKKILEVLRLHYENKFSERKIVQATGISRPVIHDIIIKSKNHDYNHLKIQENITLEKMFYPKPELGNILAYTTLYGQFPYIAKELTRKHVTLHLLWEEYKEKHTDIYSYSQFCFHFQRWREVLDVSMPIQHKSGEKVFIDFAGDKLYIYDRQTDLPIPVDAFVSVLPATLYTYVECFHNQKTASWIYGTQNAFGYYGGVPLAIVPDNAKPVVKKTDRYEPYIADQYHSFSEYYHSAVVPCRVAKPKDYPQNHIIFKINKTKANYTQFRRILKIIN